MGGASVGKYVMNAEILFDDAVKGKDSINWVNCPNGEAWRRKQLFGMNPALAMM